MRRPLKDIVVDVLSVLFIFGLVVLIFKMQLHFINAGL